MPECQGCRNVRLCSKSGGTEEITLPDVYSYKPVAGIIPLPAKWNYNSVKVHAWTGASWEETSDPNESPEKMVYVTASGTVYHKSLDCSHLKLSVSRISGSEVSSREMIPERDIMPAKAAAKARSREAMFTLPNPGTVFTMTEPAAD